MRIADLPIDVRGIIFDLDGTLFDSMPYWENLGEDYLRSRGKTPAPDIRAQFKRRTLEGSAAYMKEAYGLEEPVEEVISGIVAGIERPYRELIPLKPGVREMLDALDGNGIPMGIATATDYDLARAALERLGVWNRFGFLHTCGTVGSDKNDPRIFNLSRERLGTDRRHGRFPPCHRDGETCGIPYHRRARSGRRTGTRADRPALGCHDRELRRAVLSRLSFQRLDLPA